MKTVQYHLATKMVEGVPAASATAAMVPRILVVIAGLGSLSRVPPVAMSMRLIASDGSVNMSCLMYVYGTEEAVPSFFFKKTWETFHVWYEHEFMDVGFFFQSRRF